MVAHQLNLLFKLFENFYVAIGCSSVPMHLVLQVFGLGFVSGSQLARLGLVIFLVFVQISLGGLQLQSGGFVRRLFSFQLVLGLLQRDLSVI